MVLFFNIHYDKYTKNSRGYDSMMQGNIGDVKKYYIGSSGNNIYLERTAADFLSTLNGYEKTMVEKGIKALSAVKSPLDGFFNKIRPTFMKMKKDPGVIGNYLIDYTVFSDYVLVNRIRFNNKILGRQTKNERNAMYKVEKTNSARFNKNFRPHNLDDLKSGWEANRQSATSRIDTTHAAVNGMLNNFAKATWLMGTHLDYAYQEDNIEDYTLFHNPTDDALPDLYECARDQCGFTTDNAKHLAAVLQQVQVKQKPVKWVVHSQGGIIFKEAIRYHLKNSGGSLSHNTVAFHSGGNNQGITQTLLDKVSIKKYAADKNNPYDMVPNLAGFNDLSGGSIRRSLGFRKKVTKNKVEFESPHTLPFVNLDFYRRMLIHAGDYRSAKKVSVYMDKSGMA